jgi:hypothetical protein
MLEHKPLCAIDLEIMKTCTFLVVAKHSFRVRCLDELPQI